MTNKYTPLMNHGDGFMDFLDDALFEQARIEGYDPEHPDWDVWYETNFQLILEAYLAEMLPNLNMAIVFYARNVEANEEQRIDMTWMGK